jgi:hypothetical protein
VFVSTLPTVRDEDHLAFQHQSAPTPERARSAPSSGQLDDARGHHAAALALVSRTGDRYEQACAHHGLATIYHANCDLAQARSHWQQALARYSAICTPEAEQIHAQLAAL